MNVQITPLQTSPARDAELEEDRGGHLRTYVIGGVALALALGGFWYFTHDSGAPKARRNLAAPVKVAPVEIRDLVAGIMTDAETQLHAR